MGKRRNTARTGDKKLYASRPRQEPAALRMPLDEMSDADDQSTNPNHDNHEELQQQLLDLGTGGGESSSDDDDDESSDEDSVAADQRQGGNPQDDNSNDDESDSSSDDDADDDDDSDDSGLLQEQLEQEAATNWGGSKAAYYHGDTADLEIGQDEEDAFVEEEAARDVRESQFEEMDEDDFILPGLEAGKPAEGRMRPAEEVADTFDAHNTDKLSKAAKRKFMAKHRPEILSMVSYFSQTVKELKASTRVAAAALNQDENDTENLGKTPQGQLYVLTKSLLQGSIALDTLMYLLLLSQNNEDSGEALAGGLQSHPVLVRLKKLELAAEKAKSSLGTRVEEVEDQFSTLVKAASLVLPQGDEQADSSSEGEPSLAEKNAESSSDEDAKEQSDMPNDEDDDAESEGEDEMDDETGRLDLGEAKFSLRPREVNASKTGKPKKKSTMATEMSDFGDIDDMESKSSDRRVFAAALNSIEQRLSQKKKKKVKHLEDIDNLESETERGYEVLDEMLDESMMDEDLELETESRGAGKGAGSDAKKSSSFYSAIESLGQHKKSLKRQMYAVAPKYPGLEGEVEGERAISRTILKNRGLVAHKAKINRNPRVKKRMQYRKAIIRRKGAVREIRSDERHKYGGEGTGIKSGISRSRKL